MKALLAGLDVGTTNIKCCVFSPDGSLLSAFSTPTPWTRLNGGIEMKPEDLMHAIDLIMKNANSEISGRVHAFGITGMAEAGVILNPNGEPISPILAWNDERPDSVVGELFSKIDEFEFSGVTGLPSSGRATFAKLLWLEKRMEIPRGANWVGIPEWVNFGLTGNLVAEKSLASRTGLYDVLNDVWRDDFQIEVLKTKIQMPDLVTTDEIAGRIDSKGSIFDQAAIVIAGHDHLCAAIGTGESNTRNIVDSMGTGEALSREISIEKLSLEKIREVVKEGMTIGRHPNPNRFAAMVGLGSGLILKQALEIVGIHGDFGENEESISRISRDALDVIDAPFFKEVDPESWEIHHNGVRHSDGAIWRGALNFVGRRAQNGINLLDDHFGKHSKVVACGGWLRNSAIVETKRLHIGDYEISESAEPGCFGAALIAGKCVGLYG